MDRLLDHDVGSIITSPRPIESGGITIHLLGGFALERDSTTIRIPPSCAKLVAFLALDRRGARANVAGTLRPDVSEQRASASLRTNLWRMRRRSPGVIKTVGDRIELADHVAVDVDHFVATARRIQRDEVDLRTAGAAAELLHYELLPGWYDEWVLAERDRLRQLGLHALESLACWLCRAGAYAAALEVALQALGADLLRESAHRLVVQVHLAEGNLVEARNQYQVWCQLLRSQLGENPSVEFAKLLGAADRRLTNV